MKSANDTMFLTDEEICALTGYKLGAYQIKWLRQNGIKCLVGYDGKPRVLSSHIQEVMSLNNKKDKRRIEPDFAALKKVKTNAS